MFKSTVRTTVSLLLCACIAILFAGGANCQATATDDPTFTKHYVAQDSDEGSYEQEQYSEESSGQYEESSDGQMEQSSEYSEDGGGGGGRVSLASLVVQGIGFAFLIVFLISIPMSFGLVSCALYWKLGMVMRGGKKPDIG